MSKPLIVIFVAIVLDAIGIGLIFPILPALLRDVTHADNVAAYIGIMTALYAAMQFVFAPVLGSLSDRLGRRPVFLISLAGAAVNYLFLAIAPSLWMLLLGRAIAGLTSANLSVATAYITNISAEHKRARRFGLFNAMFGIGFIIGPVLGGVLGDHWLRLPSSRQRCSTPATSCWHFSSCRNRENPAGRRSTSPRSIRLGRCAGCFR